MKVVKIQTYKNSLIFSFVEQEKLDTNLTIITTRINLEELVFSAQYILKNKKLVIKFLEEIILKNKITKITIADYELFDIVIDLISKLKIITHLQLRDKTVLTYNDCLKIINIKHLKKLTCYSLPLFMLEKLDNNNLDVKLYSEEFYLSNFFIDNKFNNYADIYYAKTIIIDHDMKDEDYNDFDTFLEINKYLKEIYLYYYDKEIISKLIDKLYEVNIKNIKFKIYQQEDDNKALNDIGVYLNKNKVKKKNYTFKIIYSKEYISKNLFKQLTFTNLKMCALIMISILLVGISFKIYYDYKSKQEIDDIYDMLDIMEDIEVEEGNENQQMDAAEQQKVVEALTEDYEKLLAINSDTVGWIKVNNTNVNYPVVQTTDNEYYLNYNFYKKRNYNGWVFMDYRNSIEEINDNTIIYGHNGTMFGSLKNTLKERWYTNSNNQIISFNTLYGQLRYKIFAIYVTTPDFDYLVNNYKSKTNFENFLAEVKQRSIYNFNVDVTSNDKILTLSTCAENGAKRIVIHAKLI